MRAGFARTVVAVAAVLLVPLAAAGQAVRWPSSSPPRSLSARDVKFPPYELRTLPNGLQLVVVMHTEQPAVSMRAIVRAGGAQDPGGKPGVAAMVSTLLDQGTTTLSAEQVADRIDSVGGDLETGLGRDLSFARVVVMKDSLAVGMNLLADVLRNPAFAQEELERQRQQTLSALRVAYEDPEFLADVVIDRLVYGDHPYGLPGNGTVESVRALTREDIAAFHARYYAPNNCLLAVVGDITVEEAVAAVTRAFGDWERREVPPGPAIKVPDPTRRVVVIDKPDAVQTEIRVGQLGIARKDRDYMALDLVVRILGGEGANRLYRVLRSERGLTYGASADNETLKRAGQIVAEASTRSETTGEALRLIVNEIWNLKRERVGEGELGDAKAYLAGNFPLTIETPDDIATHVLNALFFELPMQELQTFRQRVNAIDVDDLESASIRYLRPDRLSVVLVGNAASFLDQLRGVGFGKNELVKLEELDLMAADFRRKAGGVR